MQAPALERTLYAVNDAANWVSAVAFERGVPREYELRRHAYAELKSRGLGAQVAQHTIKKVRDAYTTLKANIRAGHLGRPGSKRRRKAEAKPVAFRPQAAQPFDDRCLSWQYDVQTVSIWTTAGRLKNVRFVCSADVLGALREYRKGESDLVERDGVFYLIAVCEVPAAEEYEPESFVGVDLGIVNIATTSSGYRAAGRGLNRHRKRQLDLRRNLQKRGTKSAKRLLKKRNRREQRHAANINHIIAKTIVTEADAPRAGSPWKTSRESGRGYGSASPWGYLPCPKGYGGGPRSTPGLSPSSETSSSTRPAGPACPWSSSTPPTPRSSARSVVTSTRRTG